MWEGEDCEMSEDALSKIAEALERLATIEEKKFNLEHPVKPKQEGIIEKPEDEKREQFSDRADASWFAETEAATPEGKSRFLERFENPPAGNRESHDKAAGGTGKTEGKSKRTRKVPKSK